MKNHRTTFLFWITVVLTASSIAARADMLTNKQISEDDRLAKTVNIISPRIYIHDLLKQASEQTSVKVTSDDRDGASDQQIAVRLKGMKLSEVMNGVWSLFGYKGGLWHWERTGEPGSYSYTLKKPALARHLATRLKNLAQEMIDEQMELLIRFANMSPEKRSNHKKEIEEALSKPDDKIVDLILADDRMWACLKIISEVMPPQERKSLYQSDYSKRFDLALTSESSRTFAHSQWEKADSHIKNETGEVVRAPEPTIVRVNASAFGGSVTSMITVDFLQSGDGANIQTPLDPDLIERLRKMWLQTGDSFASPHLTEIVPPSVAEQPIASTRITGGRLDQVSAVMPISFMARLPREQHDPGLTGRLPLNDLLSTLRAHPSVYYSKWRGDLLLVDYPRWYLDETGVVPWKIASAIRDTVERNGMLTNIDLATNGGKLKKEQVRTLEEDDPVFGFVRSYHEVFRAAGNNSATGALTSLKGIPLSDDERAYFMKDHILNTLFINGSLEALRLSQVDSIIDGRRSREIVFEAKAPDGKWWMTSGIRQFAPEKGGSAP